MRDSNRYPFDLSVTICSWNTVEDLRACLSSLRAVRDEGSFEVLVVDNASADGSPQMVREEFPEVRLLAQTTNLGFTGGHNLALDQREGWHGMLLNSDTVVHPGALRAVLDVLQREPDAGVVGPKLLNPDGTLQYSCRRFPNPVAAAFRNTFIGRWFPQNHFTRDYLMQDWDHAEQRDVDWVSGAALVARGELIEQIGGLDPKFFMYCEDVDYCKRAWDHGYRVVYTPAGVITHAIGRSTDRAANRMIIRFHRSMLRYYLKHQVPQSPWLLRPGLAVLAALALGTRAGMFLLKNAWDAVGRRLKS